MPKIDWLQAKMDYVNSGSPSLKAISEKYGVSLKTVKQHSAKEGWLAARQKVADNAENKAMDKAAKNRITVDDRHLVAFKNMQTIVNGKLAEAQAIDDEGKISFANLTVLELRGLSAVLKEAAVMERLILGLPTNIAHNLNEDVPIPHNLPSDVEEQLMQEILSREAEQEANTTDS